MIKLTVLYGHPVEPAAFEAYYFNTHMPLVAPMHGVVKAETTKFMSAADGGKTGLLPDGRVVFQQYGRTTNCLGSPEGTATTDDLQNSLPVELLF